MAGDTTSSPSTTGPVPPGAGTDRGAADPRAELDRLKDELRKNQAQIDQMVKSTASQQQDITVLESGLGESDQAVKAYAQGLQSLGDPDSLRTFVDQKSSMAVAALGTDLGAINDLIAHMDDDIQNQVRSIPDLQAASDRAASAHAAAQQVAGAKQADYHGAKGTLARIQAGVTELKNLKNQVNAAAESGNFAGMYVLVGEMKSALKALDVPTAADLQAQLAKGLMDLKAALQDARVKKEALDNAQADLVAARKKLDDTRAGRRGLLLDAVKNRKPSAAPQAPTPTKKV
jgi:chromosome segregation ATPase